MRVADLLRKLARDEQRNGEDIAGSILIKDSERRQGFISNPNNTFLVSFPRTGSHWLRMLMELYFERPSLVRVFYYPECTDYLTYHTHDMKLEIEHPTILYLYRDPVDTVYSQLSYQKESINDQERVLHWSDLYGRHLNKWLVQEKFTKKKTVLRYEGLKRNMTTEFRKLTQHFGLDLDEEKLAAVATRITRDDVKRKTPHDPQVISTQRNYDGIREDFREQFSESIWLTLLNQRKDLKEYFFDWR